MLLRHALYRIPQEKIKSMRARAGAASATAGAFAAYYVTSSSTTTVSQKHPRSSSKRTPSPRVVFPPVLRTFLPLGGGNGVPVAHASSAKDGRDTQSTQGQGQNNRLEGLIPRFSKVQEALRGVGYSPEGGFPQIVVVGAQSSGKSSVLEMFAGEEFLPKGEGTVTRRPIILTLHNTSPRSGSGSGAASHEFPLAGTNRRGVEVFVPDSSGKERGTGLLPFSQAESAIRQANKDFTDRPLRVDVFSPDVVDLRLVDLPGLVMNPVAGQPKDLRKKVKVLVGSYAAQSCSVMLAVTPANSDPQTSEALRVCRKYDPRGERTLAVLTKCDLLVAEGEGQSSSSSSSPSSSSSSVADNARGGGAQDIAALGRQLASLPLRLGYVGVRCRSKAERERAAADLAGTSSSSSSSGLFGRSSTPANHRAAAAGEDEGTRSSAAAGNLAGALAAEASFFANADYSRAFARAGVETGTGHLAGSLNRLLESRLASQLPDIASRVRSDMQERRAELRSLGGPSPTSDRERADVIVREVSRFLDSYLGGGAADAVRRELAQTVYTEVHTACREAMPRFANTYQELQRKEFVKDLPKGAPEFWSGHDDVKYIRWREDMHRLLEDLYPRADRLASKCVDLLRDRVHPALEQSQLVSRPSLAAVVHSIVHQALGTSVDETTEHIRLLVRLEHNVSYNAEDLAGRYEGMRSASARAAKAGERLLASGGTAQKEVEATEKKGSAGGLWWLMGGSWGGNDTKPQKKESADSHDNPFRAESVKYGQLWTATYLDAMAERLATNIYNALCVEIIDNLDTRLRRECTVDLLDARREPAERNALLAENPGVEHQRNVIEVQLRELESADAVLADLLRQRR
jgi:Dynamin family/Dynamin central region